MSEADEMYRYFWQGRATRAEQQRDQLRAKLATFLAVYSPWGPKAGRPDYGVFVSTVDLLFLQRALEATGATP